MRTETLFPRSTFRPSTLVAVRIAGSTSGLALAADPPPPVGAPATAARKEADVLKQWGQ